MSVFLISDYSLKKLCIFADYRVLPNIMKSLKKQNDIQMKKLYSALIVLLISSASFCTIAQDMAYPIEGDGIYSFLRRWNRIDTSYVREFIQLNTERLNVQGGLELGTVYLIPPLHPGDTYPPQEPIYEPTDNRVFGPQFSDFTQKSNRLRNACFYIISGHGGPDPGAIANVDGVELHEHEYAYDVSLRLARNLMMEGATVYVVIQDPNDGIRDDRYLNNGNNETCLGDPIPQSQIDRLKQRVNKVNTIYERDRNKFAYIRAIEIHVDSRNKSKRIDVFFYHADNRHSLSLASAMRDVFQRKYDRHQPGRGFEGTVEYRGLYILRHLRPPSILVELGNIQNPDDRRRLVLSNNRQALANWMTEGFLEDAERVIK